MKILLQTSAWPQHVSRREEDIEINAHQEDGAADSTNTRKTTKLRIFPHLQTGIF